MHKYRIKEVNGHFSIEIEVEVKYGLFFNKIRKEWKPTNKWGTALSDRFPVPMPESSTFTSLEDAENQIMQWKADRGNPIYHYKEIWKQ